MPIKSCIRNTRGISKVRLRPLGNIDCAVSEIGFGTWGLGGTNQGAVAYGPTNDEASSAALRRAHEVGVNFFDTSDLYGHGHSEILLGRVFSECREEVFLATKAGFISVEGRQDFSLTHLEKALTASLERLRTNYVDLFQLHNPPLDLLYRDHSIHDWLVKLKQQGRARFIGASVRSPDDGLAVVADFPVDTIQVNLNLVDQRALENGLLAACADKGIGAIIRTPLCFGFLSGKVKDQEEFSRDDHRSRWSVEQRQRWCEANDVFQSFLRASPGQTAAQFALRFCLSQPGVVTVIPGMMTAAEVDENVAASGLGPLSREELAGIVGLYQTQTFFVASPPVRSLSVEASQSVKI